MVRSPAILKLFKKIKGSVKLLVVIGIDDTDNLNWEKGTGKLVSALVGKIERIINFPHDGVVRHQLFVHSDIPYTSHNSAMSFKAYVEEEKVEWLVEYISKFLSCSCAPGSDPGFCLYRPGSRQNEDRLIEFGKQAKQQVLSKEAAYGLADELDVHLSEHGGTGDGVIGALAGVGLRLSGSDGRFRGRFEYGNQDDIYTVQHLQKAASLDRIQSIDGRVLVKGDKIRLSGKVKSVLIENSKVLLVVPAEGDRESSDVNWQNCSMAYLRKHY
jgi:hypothetical protein